MSSRRGFVVPAPDGRMSVARYRELRAWLLEHDPDAKAVLQWAQRELGRPATPKDLATQVVWTILCAGRNAQAARTIEEKVWAQIRQGKPVVDVFGHRGKAAAIERAWRERRQDFAALAAIPEDDEGALIEWCGEVPYIGAATKYQLAKNFGADVVKPDVWLLRLTGVPDRLHGRCNRFFTACMNLCRPLAAATGERIATVDSLLWLACNKGVLKVSADAGPVRLALEHSTRRSILVPATA